LLAQSLFTAQVWPCAQRVAQAAELPPQSTSVSLPFLVPPQVRFTPHPLDGVPQVFPRAAQVVGTQEQVWLAPHVSGGVQWVLFVHSTQAPAPSQALPLFSVHVAPSFASP
jgi:hypothetical protein